MIYPLSWLKEYVELPKTVDELTNKLTMVGHMLDKQYKADNETIIDLELRGNRPDLLGVYGLAQEISACWDTKLKTLDSLKLTKKTKDSSLVTIKDPDLVERFLAIPLSVKVKPSPEWLKKRLGYYGLPSINNVVDITNYVMLETGEPMHAFDMDSLTGKKLIIRRARKGERMTTLGGSVVSLDQNDLVIADLTKPQGLTVIGARDSGTTASTTKIILEAAVYKYANVRHTARKLGIRTEAGARHEKILDPNQVKIALERAYKMLVDLAEAKIMDDYFDFYPQENIQKNIDLDVKQLNNLAGMTIPTDNSVNILESLGCEVRINKDILKVLAPTFRTDLIQEADLIEEVVRIYGYDKIPATNLKEIVSSSNSFPKVLLREKIQNIFTLLGYNEIISSSIIDNNLYKSDPKLVKITNPPDSGSATLRPSIILNLVRTAKKAADFNKNHLSFFEIGKVFNVIAGKESEEEMLAFICPVKNDISQKEYNLQSSYIKIVLDEFGINYNIVKSQSNPNLSSVGQGEIYCGKIKLGGFGFYQRKSFVCEISIDKLYKLTDTSESPYQLYPPYPAIYEDLTLQLANNLNLGDLVTSFKKLSPDLKDVRMIDSYNQSVTLRLTYQNDQKSISSEEIKPVREKILKLIKE